MSCTISQTVDDFTCLCMKDVGLCLQQADPYKVCLRPTARAVGGEQIWELYKQKYHPDVTTAPASVDPITKCKCTVWAVASAAMTALSVGILLVTLVRRVWKARRTRRQGGSERLREPTPDLRGDLDNPYQPTTQDLRDP